MRRIDIIALAVVLAVGVIISSQPLCAAAVLSSDADDWSMSTKLDASGDNIIDCRFYGRLVPGTEYEGLKKFGEVAGTASIIADPSIIAEEKILPIAWFIPMPSECEVIPSADSETKGEIVKCTAKDSPIPKANFAGDFVIYFAAADNLGQSGWSDGDTVGFKKSTLEANSADADKDLVPDSVDNCRDVQNDSQVDTDLDGVGDACEPEDTSGRDDPQTGLGDDTPYTPTGMSGEGGGACSLIAE